MKNQMEVNVLKTAAIYQQQIISFTTANVTNQMNNLIIREGVIPL